tara:strand:- start:773 stop:1030 length:258 start_codon:yes stop_codon:yes gene_type:complete
MTHTLNDTELAEDCNAFLGFLSKEAMDEYFWTVDMYERYVNYFEDYNRNRRPARWYCTVKILGFSDWCDANKATLERKYHEYLID